MSSSSAGLLITMVMMMKVVGEEEGWRETNTATPLSTDHCYTFKRGIRPKVLLSRY